MGYEKWKERKKEQGHQKVQQKMNIFSSIPSNNKHSRGQILSWTELVMPVFEPVCCSCRCGCHSVTHIPAHCSLCHPAAIPQAEKLWPSQTWIKIKKWRGLKSSWLKHTIVIFMVPLMLSVTYTLRTRANCQLYFSWSIFLKAVLTSDLQAHACMPFFTYVMLRLYMHALFCDRLMLSQLQL